MTSRLVVLAYHAVGDHRHDPVLSRWSVRPEMLREHLRAVTAAGWSFVALDAVLAAVDGRATLPERAVLVTFDDGYADLADTVQPILAEYDVPAVAFVVAGHVGGSNEWDQARGALPVTLLDAPGLQRLTGVDIGSHSLTHRALSELDRERRGAEVAGSAERLEQQGLGRPVAFAYPYGDCPEGATRILREAGYRLAFTLGPGAVRLDREVDPLLLPRVAVLGLDSARDLVLKLRTASWRSRPRQALLRLLGVAT